jgi:ABC-type sugar transport system ATPase subunit
MGTLQQIGTVDEVWNRPTNKFVASFVGEPEMNFFRGTIETPREISVATKEGKTVFPIAFGVLQKYLGTEIAVGVRPHDITLAVNKTEQAVLAASVDLVEFQGESAVVTVKLETRDATEARVVVLAEKMAQIEKRVWLGFRPEFIHLFDGEKTITNPESSNGQIGGARQVKEVRR